MAFAGLNELTYPAGNAEVDGVAEVRHDAVGVQEPVARSVRRGHGVDHGHRLRSRGAVEGRVAERVHAARVRDEPVPVARVVRHDRHRRPGAPADAGARPLELGVAEGEDPAVGRDHEVPVPVDGGHHADDRGVEAVGQARTGRVDPERPGRSRRSRRRRS